MTNSGATAHTPLAGRRAMAVLLLTVFVNLVGFGILMPLLPFYALSFHAPAWQVTWVFTAFSVGNFFAEPFWGRLSDRIGRKPILVGTIFCSGLGFVALAYAPNIWMVLLFRLAGGLTTGNLSTIQGYIADVTPPENRAGRMGMLGAAFAMGFVLGPALGGVLAHPHAGSAGFRLPLLIAAGMSFAAAVGVLLFVKESCDRTAHVEHHTTAATLKKVIKNPVLCRVLIVTYLFTASFAAAESTFGLWTRYKYGWGPFKVSLCFAAVAISAAIAQGFLTGRLTRRYGEAAMLAVGLGLMSVTLALQPMGQGITHTIVLLALTAFGQSLVLPNIVSLISRTTSSSGQGAVLGVNQALGALARASGPVMGGALFSIVGPDAPLLFAALLVAPAIILAMQAEQAAKAKRARF